MYKLIAIDIDGTLLDSYSEVSKENKEAIKMAIDKNIYVVLTSGRMPKAILPIANEVCANKYLISGNGAAIYDIEKNEIIYNNYMTKEKVLEIAKEKSEAIKEKSLELVEYAKEKGTPVLERTADEIRKKAVNVTKEVLNKLENPKK